MDTAAARGRRGTGVSCTAAQLASTSFEPEARDSFMGDATVRAYRVSTLSTMLVCHRARRNGSE